MNTEDFVAQLYRDLEWRLDETIALKNIITYESNIQRRDLLRKPLVMVLYAHFEGFCVFALEHYLRAVNQAALECREATPAILAGSWERVFNAMEHGDQKCEIFRKSLPNDPKLHRHWRRRHFIEETERFLSFRVSIPEEVIDTESNLKPAILQRNLFLLGLDHTFVEPYADTINNLLGRRNRIAHGDDRRGVPDAEYNGYEMAIYDICFRTIDVLQEAHKSERYRKPLPTYII